MPQPFRALSVPLAVLILCGHARAEDRILYRKTSPYNTVFVTKDSEGLLTLRFREDGARQSVVKLGDPDHLELPYARVMPVGLVFVERPQRILIVGLGGGTIPSFIHKHYPSTMIDVVDIDPEVVDVARRFFGFYEDATLKTHVGDGRSFIEACQDPYDIIFLDAFDSENIPYSLATREFLLAVRRALKPQGVVVSNIWSRLSNPLYDSMVCTYQDVFEDLYVIDVSGAGNKIVAALPRGRRIARDDFVRRATRISRANQFRFDMGDLVRYGYRHVEETNSRGKILIDKEDYRKAG